MIAASSSLILGASATEGSPLAGSKFGPNSLCDPKLDVLEPDASAGGVSTMGLGDGNELSLHVLIGARGDGVFGLTFGAGGLRARLLTEGSNLKACAWLAPDDEAAFTSSR